MITHNYKSLINYLFGTAAQYWETLFKLRIVLDFDEIDRYGHDFKPLIRHIF